MRATYVDPETNKTTNLPSKFEHAYKTTTNSRWRDLRDIDRSQVTSSTYTQTRKNTTSIDQTESSLAIGTKHQPGTENEDSREDSKTRSATHEVSSDIRKDGTEESSSLVAGNDVGVEEVDGFGSELLEVEFIFERWECESGSDEGTVVTIFIVNTEIYRQLERCSYPIMIAAEPARAAQA